MKYDYLVLGYGVSGQSALNYIKSRDADAKLLVADQVVHEPASGDHNTDFTDFTQLRNHEYQKIIISPGISPSEPFVQGLDFTKVVSALEFGLQQAKGQKLVGITGTNGKSTITKMVEFLCQKIDIAAVACGNIGEPVCETLLRQEKFTHLIVELSSYQLYYLRNTRFAVGAVSSLSPDHLLWHGSLQNYYQAKIKLSLHCDSKIILPSQALRELHQHGLKPETHCPRGWAEVAELPPNTAIACQIAHQIDPSKSLSELRDHLADFKNLPHRCEQFIDRPKIINDSKATNLESVQYALAKDLGPLTLVFGGTAKQGTRLEDFDFFSKPAMVILYGELGLKLLPILNRAGTPSHYYPTLKNALKFEHMKTWFDGSLATLFSPGTPSFDEFKSFKERGLFFKQQCLSFVKNQGFFGSST